MNRRVIPEIDEARITGALVEEDHSQRLVTARICVLQGNVSHI